ncbi:major capsid protein [Microviridae sp.]|nr:major capsid protein [Microviridae sp.]
MRSQHSFSQVPSVNLPRSSFNLSHPHKTTFDADYLVPIMQPVDIIPGDTFNVRTDFFMRLATPLHPILDNLYFETFYFFVPYRLIWDNFEKFHGAQDDPGDSTDFTIPKLGAVSTFTIGNLGDYMTPPLAIDPGTTDVSALPFRAYRFIWNEWFRDENLQDQVTFVTDDGPDANTETGWRDAPLKRGKRHDYLTSCLPWPQKGNSVALPLGTVAPVTGIGINNAVAPNASSVSVRETEGSSPVTYASAWNTAGSTTFNIEEDTTAGATADYPGIYADLSGATAATINDLRLAFMTQKILETDARSGTRYVEKLKGTWGVTSPDFRLQRPEFLGGGSTRVNVTPVAQTSGQPAPAADDKLGGLAGFGTASGSHGFTQSFVEHGVVIALGNLRGDISYFQGLDRYWSKSTAYDFYYPPLATIGEQAVLNKEIYVQNTTDDEDVLGYQERYGEYRFLNGKVTGLFRPDAPSSLSPWILTESFSSLPTLGDTFIQANTGDPLDDAIAVPTEPHMIADFFHNIKAARPLPMFGVPGGLGRL